MKDFPDIFKLADDGMKKTIDIENTRGSVIQQGNAFADMILPMLNCIESLTQEETDFIRGISIWLCLVDAIDDYEEDLRLGRYNPLWAFHRGSIPSGRVFFDNYMYICETYKSIKMLLNKPRSISNNQETLNILGVFIDFIIPFQTKKVLSKVYKKHT